uniref:Uncharacterized protein n=1 Tax=Arion vulgaris TaxID=1028688 RepID=A0A0B6ZQY7_9EUPU
MNYIITVIVCSYQAPGSTNIVWTGAAKPRKQAGGQKNSAAVKDLKTAASKPKWNRRDRKDGSKVSDKQSSNKKPYDACKV